MARLSRLFVYPIKSCRGIELDAAELTPRGLAFDRRYMLVDAAGRFLTQRRFPQMALIQTAFTDSGLRVEAPGVAPLELPHLGAVGTSEICTVRIWQDSVEATLAAPEVNIWFSEVMGFAAGLVYLADFQHRPVPNASARFDDEVGFADGAPVLLISEPSLEALNARLPAPVGIERFRPNLVVTADAPHAEDDWAAITIGKARLDVAWPCSRCALPNVDPATGVPDPEGQPLKTLMSYRRRDRSVHFGQNLIPRALGRLEVGAECVVEKRAEA